MNWRWWVPYAAIIACLALGVLIGAVLGGHI